MYDILLISPSNYQLGRFKRFVPRSVPIGLGIIAGFLRENGLSIKLMDQELVEINRETVEEALGECAKPLIVGISVMTANIAGGYKLAELIKSVDKDAVVVFGGIHATVMPDEIIEHESVDYVVKGEGEYAFLALIRQIKQGRIEPDKLENVAFMDGGKPVHSKAATRMVDPNDVPMFPYDMFDKTKYDLGFILTSRGCPFDCIFCSQRVITKRRYRFTSSERVIKEIDYLINELKQPNITFFDDYFTGDKARVYELCHMIIEKGFNKHTSFGVQTRGDSIDREMMKIMREANFQSLMFGVETASERLMKLINKGETVKDNVDAIKLAKEMGFTVEATFIFGFPTETYEDRFEAFSLAVSCGIDRARFNNATPYPGTEMYEMVKDEIKKMPGWTNFNAAGAMTAGLSGDYQLPYIPENCDKNELEGEVLLANFLFYLNFSKLKCLFNADQSGSGKWFEVTSKELRSIRTLLSLALLGGNVALRALKYLLTSRNCRRFFFKAIRQ